MGCLNANIGRVGAGLNANIGRVGAGLNATIGLVCSVNKAAYLRVEPEYIWLMKSNDFKGEVAVWSNVKWRTSY